jgi:hypothetical protein
MLLLFIVGNPGSGGVYPPEFLPGLFRDLHRWLPTGQATELVRAVEYFGGHATAWPAIGLASWAVGGLIAVLGATLALGQRHAPRPTSAEADAPRPEVTPTPPETAEVAAG